MLSFNTNDLKFPYIFLIFMIITSTAVAGNGGRKVDLASGGAPSGASGSGHGPNWDYSWGWGSAPGSGWGYGSG
ncbi:glycine-rich protein, partial [Trifolium medium]|nr:glycine-rich protein [Trifolium medium]